jgi:hypothetical protein
MHLNLHQVLEFLTDYFHDHWSKLAMAALFMAIGWLFGKRRARGEWRRREFYNRVNISLNAIREGTLRIRTIAERHCSDVFLNSVATDALINSARETTPENPMIALPEHDYWFYLNAVLNELSEKFGEGQIRRDMGLAYHNDLRHLPDERIGRRSADAENPRHAHPEGAVGEIAGKRA